MKKCKGIGKALGFEGCGTPSEFRRYGLCSQCLSSWATSTDTGRDWLKTQTAYKMRKKEKENKKVEREKKSQMKIDIMSNTKYWSKELQPKINLIARLIDHGHPCICTEQYGKLNGGHYISVGANRSMSLNLHNIHVQSFQSNHWQSGDTLKYQAGIRRVYGDEYLDFIEGMKKMPSLNITKIEMQEYRKKAMYLIKILKGNMKIRTPEERILLRNAINIDLGIYPEQYSIYIDAKTKETISGKDNPFHGIVKKKG